jgi:hypothetical protein
LWRHATNLADQEVQIYEKLAVKFLGKISSLKSFYEVNFDIKIHLNF